MEDYNQQFQVDAKLLASVVHFLEDSAVITDSRLDEPGPKIIYVNPAFTRLTGYKPKEILGKTPRILQGPKTDRQVLKRLRNTLEKGQVFYGQAVNYHKDGSEFINEWHIEPIRDHNETITHFMAIQHDVTDRVKTQQAIEQKNAALKETPAFLKKNTTRTALLVGWSSELSVSIEPWFKKEGLQVHSTQTLREAFDILAMNEVIMVIANETLPGSSVTDFLRRVQALSRGTACIISGYCSNSRMLVKATNDGAIDNYLEYPLGEELLRETIHAAIGKYTKIRSQKPFTRQKQPVLTAAPPADKNSASPEVR